LEDDYEETIMPAAARQGDPDTGGQSIDNGSGNVFVNGKPLAYKGCTDSDPVVRHTIIQGSGNVFVNGKPVVRVGDKDDANDKIKAGSPNVFVN
jgi:uncharacterized Zn-binding protein involved in type VI secretion